MKIYYSHPKPYKRSKEAKQDMQLLQSLGYEVINPYDPKFSECWEEQKMAFSEIIIEMADVVAFRALSNKKISSGVGKELSIAISMGKDIMELPNVTMFDKSTLDARVLNIDDTMSFFKNTGK